MSCELLRIDEDRYVVTLEINRPQSRNALSDEVLRLLVEELEDCDRDPEVRCIVLRGSDKVFASGADLVSLSRVDPIDHYAGERFRNWAATRRVRTPTVAAVSGFCLGGGLELALSCDIVVAAPSARFGLPETSLGLIPAAGGTQHLPRTIGRAKALDVILTGRLLTAAEAEAAGLVSRLADQSSWRDEAAEVACEVARRGPLAQQLAKEAVAASYEVPLEAGIEIERRAFALAFGSDEAREGIAAFLEKRDPTWTDAVDGNRRGRTIAATAPRGEVTHGDEGR